MTPEAQRIAIAEACGWTQVGAYESAGSGVPFLGGLNPRSRRIEPLLDYLNDLNAMHEAEKVLLNSGKSGIWTTYLYWLEVICDVPMHHATSSQRAEAFRRTLNL